MGGLVVDLAEGESVTIGCAVVRFHGKRGRKVRLRVEAPQDQKITRQKIPEDATP